MPTGQPQVGANPDKVRIEDYYKPNEDHLSYVGRVYDYFYRFRNQRSGVLRQLQYHSFDSYLAISRELFWNSTITQSEDLKKIGLDFSLPFIRKEVMEFLGRVSALGVKPKINGENLGIYGSSVLNSIYKKWRLKNKDTVEKFYQLLYALVNGTLCIQYGFDDKESTRRYFKRFNPQMGIYDVETEKVKVWNDVTSVVVPIEEIYLAKLWERNIQKQGKVIRLQEMSWAEFQVSFEVYPESKNVIPGWRISEDSLYYRLLGGSGVTTADKVQVLHLFDTDNDEYMIMANGIWLNYLGTKDTPKPCPMPFRHGMMPFAWVLQEPIDEKFAYGLSLPFKEKDPHKLLNTAYTMLVERELRAIDPPFLTSDFEAPKIIFGQKKVIPVNDVTAYKELEIQEASQSFYNMMNSLQTTMSTQSQGGNSDIVPSRQPTSAREVSGNELMKQQAMSNAQIMYYDLVYQEFNLVVKTALQFYQSGKYEERNLMRTLLIPNSPLTRGGIGNTEVRIVKKPQDALTLHFEGVLKSIHNGKETEIIEVPVDTLNNLDFFIEEIVLEPEETSDIQKANFFERVLQPMTTTFIPAGIADPGKVFLRYIEMMGEHPSDYVSDQVLMKLMGSWGQPSPFSDFFRQQALGKTGPQAGGLKTGIQTGNVTNGIMQGQQFGGQSNGGYPQLGQGQPQ